MNHQGTKKEMPPARLFVLLARKAPVGVILRRGPKQWVQLIKWHTDTDRFEEGQWLHAAVSEYNGDLSPDGSLFLYHARDKRNWHLFPEKRNANDKALVYDAISKPPYFTALAIWRYMEVPGGQFLDNATIQFYTFSGWHPIRTVPELKIEIERYEPNTDPKGVFLGSQGWSKILPTHVMDTEGRSSPNPLNTIDVWSKSTSELSLSIEFPSYRGDHQMRPKNNYTEYSIQTDNGRNTILENTNWADFDHQGRLVLARDGKLFSAALQDGELIYTELADFNANKPEPVEAPEWARKW